MTCLICLEGCDISRLPEVCTCSYIVCDSCWPRTTKCLICRKKFPINLHLTPLEYISIFLVICSINMGSYGFLNGAANRFEQLIGVLTNLIIIVFLIDLDTLELYIIFNVGYNIAYVQNNGIVDTVCTIIPRVC